MRRYRTQRSPLQRFAIFIFALCILALGYYLGNRYQASGLHNISAIVLDIPVVVPAETLPQPLRKQIEAEDQWVVLLPGENGKACDELLTHYIEVVNRLAAWPKIQARIRVALLDTAGRAGSPAWQAIEWADSHNMSQTSILALTSTLGISPVGNRWCRDVQATAALIGPGNTARALLPLDNPAEMAESLRLLVATLDPDV